MTAASAISPSRPLAAQERPRLDVGLVNNMPDAALHATERQFGGLLAAAAADAYDIRIHLFHLPVLTRSPSAAAQMRGRYAAIEQLPQWGLDAVIVTGAKPETSELRDEACWPDLATLVDHVAAAGIASIWSCLAAQAAVLRLDGVTRRAFGTKLTGVFPWTRVGRTSALEGLAASGLTPHSRFNDLPEEALSAAGYEIIGHSPVAGADTFAKHRGGLFLFLQGHPEYDGDSLLREYRRDLARWAQGEGARPPVVPTNYFPPAVAGALERVGRGRGSRAAADAGRAASAIAGLAPAAPWREGAISLFRSWLASVAEKKTSDRQDRQRAVARPA